MDHIILATILFFLSVWIFLWFNKSTNLGLDINYVWKQWWAQFYLKNIKKKTNKSKSCDDTAIYYIKKILQPSVTDNPKTIIDENSCESLSFYGADQKGNSLWIKMNHRSYHMVEISLQLILPDGRVYVLPHYPDTVAMRGADQIWSANGLKIEALEPRQRWRIVYNGLLRNQSRGDASNDDSVEHIRLNFIFMRHSQSSEWPEDWSNSLHASALAYEPWKDPSWRKKIKLLDYTGFDHWGSMIGQVTFSDLSASTLYLRGLCQRRGGKHESHEFHRIVTFLGVTTHGAMYYLGVSSTKRSFSHMCFGHILEVGGVISKIDWTDLKLSDFDKGDSVPLNYKITFKAGGKQYNAIINYTVGNPTICYNGQPWHWTYTTRNLRIELNNNKGVGLMITSYPYTGPKQTKTPVAKLQYLTRPDTFAQKDKYILHFTDKQCQNENVVGGKGYSLAVLTSIVTDDFAVPEGFCITSLALERQLQHHQQLQDSIADIVDISCGRKKEDLRSYCEKAVSIIQSTPVEEEIVKVILEGLEKLKSSVNEGDGAQIQYAVRSSAIGEDSEETSAAGQNATYLGVKNANDVVENVAKCWASLFSHQSVEYRRQNGLPIRATMAVCVQKMVDGEAAGVMFTRHPVTGDPSSIIISANYGLGETVVSGLVEPDTLEIHRKWDDTLTISSSTVGNKTLKISLSKDGVTISNLSERETKRISISDATAMQLAKIGLYLESIFGSARDVEWAVIGGQIFLLQARPITTIYAWTDFELMHELDGVVPCDVDLLTFANVGEVFPHSVSPLTISTVLKILNLSIGARYNIFHSNLIHTIGMRCVLNYLDSSLRDVDEKVTISNKMIDLAICGRIVMTPEVHQTAIEKYGVISTWRKIYFTCDMIRVAYANEATVKRAIDIFNKYTIDADKFDTPHDLYSAISKKYEEVYLIGKYHNMTSYSNIVYQMIIMSVLTWGSSDFTSDHFADIAVLLSSCTNVISTQVPIALGKIATCIRQCGKAEEFSKIEPAKALDWLKSNCPSAAEKLQNFFDVHGHRALQELDLFAEPWIFKPDSIINMIQTLAMSSEENHANKTLSVEETIASLKTDISSFARRILRFIIPLSRKAVTRREMTKSIIASMCHKLRVAYKRLGALMVAENFIPDEDFVFFLTHQEIGQLLNNHNAHLVRKALRRKKIYHQAAKLEYPEFVIGMPEPIEKTFHPSSQKEKCTKINGTSVCTGSVVSRACVITDLSEAKNIQNGDILITHCTDIGWSPYFPLLTGIVTELGGLISHGAVVAREYGLPCIVGAKNATKVFKTGDMVLLAGNVGVLELIQKA
ncbi:rifampicin phosphotransferase-like [Linepithema humile]|uniref:rifampicin phosphotransferase-like n=1 Tax=Linepithema humile TaxID=83485 RepID=UPI00062328AF|nr:PREDICTED: uncharacterized protein LOC105675166 [Linepithema humile]XP_012227532.1 PREDICTED: uncharacterized protein LOC105675166 [Linepithema humile]XP_012227533.1 PREDICTED: uncharacterized protein LOC105675166 [Linepithema humile]